MNNGHVNHREFIPYMIYFDPLFLSQSHLLPSAQPLFPILICKTLQFILFFFYILLFLPLL